VCVPYRVTPTLKGLSGDTISTAKGQIMTGDKFSGIGEAMQRNESLTIHRGETFGDAVRRHWRLNGVGPLSLIRSHRVSTSGGRARVRVAA